ncbi:MAG: hypothetical protein M0Z92_03200 [Actinomycetota bacterium]|jgi:hypothetical protein|nr:hypothetical protein [Actinomycetota bacterium]
MSNGTDQETSGPDDERGYQVLAKYDLKEDKKNHLNAEFIEIRLKKSYQPKDPQHKDKLFTARYPVWGFREEGEQIVRIVLMDTVFSAPHVEETVEEAEEKVAFTEPDEGKRQLVLWSVCPPDDSEWHSRFYMRQFLGSGRLAKWEDLNDKTIEIGWFVRALPQKGGQSGESSAESAGSTATTDEASGGAWIVNLRFYENKKAAAKHLTDHKKCLSKHNDGEEVAANTKQDEKQDV